MGIMHRIGNRSPHAVAIFAVLFAVAYLAVISIQIRLGYWLGSTRDKSRRVGLRTFRNQIAKRRRTEGLA